MKTLRTCLGAILVMLAGDALTLAQAPPSTTQPPASPTASPSAATPPGAATVNAAPAANPAAPPSAAPEKSDADLDKLVAPIALYPDPLIATVLPASAYPLEIVQAARFVKDTNNVAKLDTQPWDDNVKEVAKFPDVINQMNDNIQWTSDLGDAFINQPKGVTDAIQRMRVKAEGSGALKTTEQQVVTVTNTIVTNIVEQVPVYVTNQVVQVQPAQPDVIYVPQYNPTVVYAGYPAAYPGYVSPPYYPVASAAVTFGLGMAAGAIVANNCDWGHGGCWGGSYHSDVNVNRNVNVNNTANVNRNNANVNRNNANVNRNNANVNRGANANGQKWQPDQNRLKNSGSTMSSSQNREARGYGSGTSASGANRSTAASQRASAAQNLSASERSSATPNRSGAATENRSGSATPRSSGGSGLSPTGPSGDRQSSPSANRPSSSQSANRPSSSQTANRPSSSQSANRPSSSQSASRPSSSGSSGSSGRSAFSGGGGGGASTQAASSRGSASRGGGGGSRGGGGGRR